MVLIESVYTTKKNDNPSKSHSQEISSSNDINNIPLSAVTTSSKHNYQISYSGELDDNDEKSETDVNSQVHPYEPDFSELVDANNDPHNKFMRQISREDASSIIGGRSLSSPNLNGKNNNDNNNFISNSARVPLNKTSTDISISSLRLNDNNYTSDEKYKRASVAKFENEHLQEDENNLGSQKVFNFSFPFSNPTTTEDELRGGKGSEPASETTSIAYSLIPTRTEPISPSAHHHEDSVFSKTFKKLSHILPFHKRCNNNLTENEETRPVLLRRASHPEAPTPPPDVYVYWDDIAHKLVPDEVADREDVRLKLERQESLDTLQEARYYKDIDHLDDGKLKALRKSILRAPSLSLSQSITSKISYVTTKIKSDSPTSPITSIPEPEEKLSVINNPANNTLTDRVANHRNSIALSSLAADGNNASSTSLNASTDGTSTEKDLSNEVTNKNNNTNHNNPVISTLTTASKLFTAVPMSPLASISNKTNEFNPMQIFDELDGDVLVIGGYRGSILRDSKTHRRTWIPVLKAGLNIRKINLVLGPNDEDELRELNARDVIFNLESSSKVNPSSKDYPTMYPDGMITHVGPVDITRRLIKRLNANPNVTATDWGYDWRLSPDLICEQLHSKLKDMVAAQKVKKGVILIAHSMGGIIAHGAMIKDPTLVRSILYAGTPMPCANILGPLRFTDSILLSREVLTHEANFFMRSSFVFVPPSWGGEDKNGKGGGMCLYRDLRSGKRIMVDFWDEKNWVYYNLSPLVSSVRLKLEVANGNLKIHNIKDSKLRQEIKRFLKIKVEHETELIVLDEISRLHKPVVPWLDCYLYLSRTLKRTKKFIKSLERKDDVKYPPMAQIFSNGVPSVKYSLVDGEEGIKRGEYYRFFYGPGDGVVYQGWNFPRERGRKRLHGPDKCGEGSIDPVSNVSDWRGREYGYGEKYAYDLCGRFRSTAGHIGLLADLDLVAQALSSLVDEEKRRILEN